MNTRVAVTLTKEAYDAVTLLAEIGKTSRAKVLGGAVEAAVPALVTIADAYREAMAVEGQERNTIVKSFETAEQFLLDALTQSSGSLLKNMSGSDGRDSDAKRGVSRRSDPPILTGGFRKVDNGGSDEV